jgi:hypothetical protein
LPGSPLGLGGPRAGVRRSRLILSSGQFDLCVAKFAGQIVEPGAELIHQCLGRGQARGQSGDFILLLRVLTVAVLDFLNDMSPIDLVGHRFSGREAAKQGTLRLGPQPNVLAIEIAVFAHLP